MTNGEDGPADALDGVYWKAAKEVLQDLELVLAEPMLDPNPVELARFPWLDQRWYEKTTATLEAQNFHILRDLDASALTAKGAPAMCVRVMLAEDGRTSAALYQAIPRSPGAFLKFILWILGKWQKPRIVEFMSYTDDGRVIGTSNQGDVNVFSAPSNCSRQNLALSTAPAQVLAAHKAHVEGVGGPVIAFASFEDLNAAREKQRERQNAWRREVGLLPEELDRMLAPHGKNGVTLRPYLERALRERSGEPAT